MLIEYGDRSLDLVDEIGSDSLAVIAGEIKVGYNGLLCRPLHSLIDIGAHVGAISLLVAALNPACRIWAIEACWTNYCNLQRNLDTHRGIHQGRITPFFAALSSSSGKVITVSHDRHNTGGASAVWQKSIADGNVLTISFDDLFRMTGLDTIDAVKMDCEGSEHEIVSGSRRLGKPHVSWLSAEIHTNGGDDCAAATILRLHERFGGDMVCNLSRS